MDHLHKAGKIQARTRRVLAGNRLVVVRAHGLPPSTAEDTATLRHALAGGRVATGDPAHVPVGRYAEAALRSLGLWDEVGARLVRAENVRSALAFVERGEAPAGIVYATDVAAAGKVRIAARFPRASHPAVQYPVALLEGAKPEAAAVLAALFSAQAKAVLQRGGFEPPAA
jgi:molybdate transport system substrate-binding protein